MTRRVAGCLLRLASAATLAGACAPPSPRAPAADGRPSPEASPADRISLERGPCFGTCPVYRVTLDRAGTVTFEGRRFVADTGVSLGSASPGAVDSLFTELAAAGYFDFAERYVAGEPGCERYATDLPTVVTEVAAGGRIRRIEHDHGCAEAPAALSKLEGTIDEVAGVGRWVGR